MPRDVPLKVVKNSKLAEESRAEDKKSRSKDKPRVSPYDIILGKVDLDYQQIPSYM
jgi:hypothetical protein